MESRGPRLPPLSSLRPFEAAVRLESVTRAAAELGLTQTAVSKQIRQLEQDLGLPLFERRNRSVVPSEEGRRFAQIVGEALADIGEEAARLRGGSGENEVVLHCQLCEAFYWLMPRLSRFHEQHPNIELRVVSSMRPLTESAVAFDVALQTTGRPSGSARLAFTANDEVFPVCAPSLVGNLPLPLTPHDLRAFPLLAHVAVPQDWLDWDTWFNAVDVIMPRRLRKVGYDSFPLVLQAAVAGQGVALGWRRTVEGMLEDGKLIAPCIESVARPTEIAVFAASSGIRRAKARPLIDWLKEELSDRRDATTAPAR